MHKGRRLSSQAYRAALRDRDELWDELQVHSVTDSLIATASRSAIEHTLRAYDCLHLATIATFADAERVTVACWDRDLRKAVREHGFPLVPERLG
jgi:predicted nucleic acid-binding protein